MVVFEAKRGVKLNFWFCDPQKAHPCAEPRLSTYSCVKIRAGDLAVDDLKTPHPKKNEQIAE